MFRDRKDAGEKLASLLSGIELLHPVIYAIPRGGVIVAYEVAKKLNADLTVIAVKKIGHPLEPEFAVGAIAEGDPETVIFGKGTDSSTLDREISLARADVKMRALRYRNGMPLVSCRNRSAIVVDDGVATGLTAQAALLAVRKFKPRELILAVPVIDRAVEIELQKSCDRIVSVENVKFLQAVGSFYLEFPQSEDSEVMRCLHSAEQNFPES